MRTELADGLYAVVYDPRGICAGFIVRGGEVVECAPILRRRLASWLASPYVRLVAAPRKVGQLRILVTGSRDWPTEQGWVIRQAIDEAVAGRDVRAVTVVDGGARGADTIAHSYAARRGCRVETHRANWARHGDAAGMIRNRAMVALGADVVLAFPLGRSPGTRGCIREAKRAGLRVVVHDAVSTCDK